jgi:hypothetical protein
MQKRFIFYAFFLVRFASIFGTITIDIDLPEMLKKNIEGKHKYIAKVCYSNLGCYPSMLPKTDLKLTLQLVTDKDLSAEDLRKVRQVVEKAAQQIDPFKITGNANFGLMSYGGDDYTKWSNPPGQQYQGDWVVFELAPQGALANLKNVLQEELKNIGIPVIDHKPVIVIGFTRFTEVKNAIEKEKEQVSGLALNFQINELQINKTTLLQEIGKGFDRINIKKENQGTYPLGRKVRPEDVLMNALKNLEGAFIRLVDALRMIVKN